MKTALRIGMASVLALATAAPVLAQQPQYQPQQYQQSPQDQPPPGPQYQQTGPSTQDQQQYQQDRRDYEARKDAYDAGRQAYDARRNNYEAERAGYREARAAYDRRRADWERARANYDARYGYGAYIRIYGPAPAWDVARWGPYEGPPPYAGNYGRQTYYVAPGPGPVVECRNDHSAATAGTILGAIAGAALGSNVAASGHRSAGAILGGVVGAGIGGSVGAAHDRYRCDSRGPYYAYSDTVSYRVSPDYRSARYDDYMRMRCRLAPAPIDRDGRDVRYVRVCPDADGRYRITG